MVQRTEDEWTRYQTDLIKKTEGHDQHGNHQVGGRQGQDQVVGHALQTALYHDGRDDKHVPQNGRHDHAAKQEADDC